jgi:hypothetical protein
LSVEIGTPEGDDTVHTGDAHRDVVAVDLSPTQVGDFVPLGVGLVAKRGVSLMMATAL